MWTDKLYRYRMSFGLIVGLFAGVAISGHCMDLPADVRKIVEEKYPGAEITEVEEESWKGQVVTEIEFTAQGRNYEMLLSKTGEILSIKEKKGLPLIGGDLSIGLAIQAEREIYRGATTEFEPSPFFLYENGPFEITAYDSIEASLRVYQGSIFSVALNASLDLEEGYDTDDSSFLEGMDELETLYGAGIQIGALYKGWEIGLDVNQDLSGEHDGREIELTFTYPKVIGGGELRPELSVTWMSSDMVDYFYGVSESEARADRSAYFPGSGFEVGAELMIQRPIIGNLTGVGIIGGSYFSSDVTDSSIVDRDYEIEAVIGLMYRY